MMPVEAADTVFALSLETREKVEVAEAGAQGSLDSGDLVVVGVAKTVSRWNDGASLKD